VNPLKRNINSTLFKNFPYKDIICGGSNPNDFKIPGAARGPVPILRKICDLASTMKNIGIFFGLIPQKPQKL
jgi:hypothetical protein